MKKRLPRWPLLVLTLCTLSFPRIVFAHDRNSAVRLPGEDFRVAAERARATGEFPGTSAYDVAVPYAELNISQVPMWISRAAIFSTFYLLRDQRFLSDPQTPQFARRSSWLYPQDGCWIRAALANIRLKSWGFRPQAKLFVFGDLSVKTANSPTGGVQWWYHVVPVVRAPGNQVFAIDPAIEPSGPLPLNEWLSRMGDPSTFKLSICNPSTYGPEDDCAGATPPAKDSAISDQETYLTLERANLSALGRNPDRELGPCPPWRSSLDPRCALE